MHARMHASPYGSKMYNTYQFDPQLWGGPYPSLKMVSVWSLLYLFSVQNRTGGKPRFDAQLWGGPYPSLKMVSLWSSMCSFSVRNRPGGKLREFSGVNHQARNQKWQEHFPVRASMPCARASVWHLCVYLGVCVDECKLACACACENECNKGCSISVVCH